MASQKNSVASPLLRDLFRVELYKRSQGRITRQVTFAAMAAAVVLGLWSLNSYGRFEAMLSLGRRLTVSSVLLFAGLWICYRLVNMPRFADFLIAVEAEMNKVSWPSRGELVRSSIVVLVTVFSLAIILFLYDFGWSMFLSALGVTGS